MRESNSLRWLHVLTWTRICPCQSLMNLLRQVHMLSQSVPAYMSQCMISYGSAGCFTNSWLQAKQAHTELGGAKAFVISWRSIINISMLDIVRSSSNTDNFWLNHEWNSQQMLQGVLTLRKTFQYSEGGVIIWTGSVRISSFRVEYHHFEGEWISTFQY